ncbi:MAG: hypothetical protein JSW52_03050 [Candidatus Coatesbacteria bacterium]|nr:MAG: hypothetical protein JSW52_03050 [Candidatus Coatesbacteria bacterium]
MIRRHNLFRPVRLLAVGLIILGAAVMTVSAVKYKHTGTGTTYGRATAYDYMTAGQLWLKVWNIMGCGDASGDHAGEWPGGSGASYVYTGNYWFGWAEGETIYVIQEWQLTELEWHPLPPCENQILMSNNENWSELPYVEAGISADPVSDLDCFTWCDDSDAGENGPIGLRTYMRGYQWGVPGHDDWIVFEYKVWNQHGSDLNGYFLANPYDNDCGGGLDYIDDLVLFEGNDSTDLWTNPNVAGQPWTNPTPDGIPDENDYVNFNNLEEGFQRLMPVMYDAGGEERDFPGYIGLRMMFVEFNPEDSNTFSYRVRSQHSWDIMNDPETDAHKYGYLADVDTYEEITTPYDWRVCPASGPLDIAKDATQVWWCAVVMGADLNDMRMNSDQMYADFLGPDGTPGTDDDWFVPSPPRAPRLVGIKGDDQVTLRWNPAYEIGKNLETEPDNSTGVVDFDGYVVWRSDIGYDIGWEPIIWVDKLTTNARAYFPWGWRTGERTPDGYDPQHPDGHSPVEPDLTVVPQNRMVTYESITGDSSPVQKVAGQFYEYVDNDVVNGTRYYYAVVAYDFGDRDPVTDVTTEPAIGGKNANALDIIPTMPVTNNLANVKVVPNPYRGSADWEEWSPSGIRLGRIYFTNLPAECTIRIYTIAGDLVKTIARNDTEYGAEPWDLTGEAGVQVASGIYVYHIEMSGSDETTIGKFAVLVGQN